jgi:hypothetical protein
LCVQGILYYLWDVDMKIEMLSYDKHVVK